MELVPAEAARPRPPVVLLDLLPRLAGTITRVVDLGAGTGLSTRLWAAHAAEVIGVEASATLRAEAVRRTATPHISYVAGATGLPDESVDLVTATQSLQWMDRGPTLAETARILRPGGVLAAYHHTSLSTGNWQADAAFAKLRGRVRRRRSELDLDSGRHPWPVTPEAFAATGHFRHVSRATLHSIEPGSGPRLLALALSDGSLQTVLPHATESELGLTDLRTTTAALPATLWHVGYELVYAIK